MYSQEKKSSMLNLDNTKDGFILMNNKLKELSEY